MKLNECTDHTNLKPQTTVHDIVNLCEEAKKYNFKSVCVNPTHIEHAKELLKGSGVFVCTVIGYPLGANTKETKVFETKDAIKKGADEIDMVINIGRAKINDFAYIEDEIRQVVEASKGKVVKVIIDTCLLTDEEKVKVCQAAENAKASFVETTTVKDIPLMKKTVGNNIGIKALDDICSKEEFLAMIENGATRIGTSSGVKLINDEISK